MSPSHRKGMVNAAIVAATLAAVLAGGVWLAHALQWRGTVASSASSAPTDAAQARLERGWRTLRHGNAFAASRAFQDALRISPGWSEALRGLAWAQARLGRYDLAALAMRRAMASRESLQGSEGAALLAWQQALLRRAGARYGNAKDAAPAGE